MKPNLSKDTHLTGHETEIQEYGTVVNRPLSLDLHQLVTQLELRDFALAGFSMGGGEVARYFGKYGSKGVSKAVFISGVPPFLLKTPENPEGVDGGVFEGIQKTVAADRYAFFTDFNLGARRTVACRA
jgi:pimeloyl-ACP methyl ester carboxylesterase